MRHRRRDRRSRDRSRVGPIELKEEQCFFAKVRQIQLIAAAVMFAGVATATFVCAGEFPLPWLVAGGGCVFLAGLSLYGLAHPLARRMIRGR